MFGFFKTNNWCWWHFVCIALALLVSVASAFMRPAWCDEVAYIDPGAQLALTGKMVSTAWVTNSPEALWGSSNPGMPLLFAGWFKLFGFGHMQARLLFCFLHLTGVLLVFQWIQRECSPSPWALSLGIISSLLLPSLANAIFQCRLESVALLLCAWFLYYAFNDNAGFFAYWVAAPLLGLVVVFFGLHFAGFFCLAAVAVYISMPSWRILVQGLGLAIGIIVGLVLLWLVYSQFGIWDTFVAARACHYGRALEWVPVGWKRFDVTPDLPVLACLATTGLLSSLPWARCPHVRDWIPWATALSIFFLLPVLISLVGVYYGNYSWMVALPIMLCFFVGAPKLTGWFKYVFIFILSIGIIAAGIKSVKHLPGQARDGRQRWRVVEVLKENLNKGDAVAADFQFYYILVDAGFRIYPRVKLDEGRCLGYEQESFLPQTSRQNIGCIVSRRSGSSQILSGLGGSWRLIAEVPVISGNPCDDDYLIYLRK